MLTTRLYLFSSNNLQLWEGWFNACLQPSYPITELDPTVVFDLISLYFYLKTGPMPLSGLLIEYARST